MQLDDTTVRAVTHEVCNTTFGLPISDLAGAVDVLASDNVAADVRVQGNWNARIAIVASKSLARELAGRMFQQDAANVEEADMEDSLCEFANIIGGNLKGIVGEEADLSIPAYYPSTPSELNEATLATSFEHNAEGFSVVVQAC